MRVAPLGCAGHRLGCGRRVSAWELASGPARGSGPGGGGASGGAGAGVAAASDRGDRRRSTGLGGRARRARGCGRADGPASRRWRGAGLVAGARRGSRPELDQRRQRDDRTANSAHEQVSRAASRASRSVRRDARGHGRAGCSTDRVVAAGMPGAAAGDALGAHPAASQQPVAARWPARCSASSSARSGRSDGIHANTIR